MSEREVTEGQMPIEEVRELWRWALHEDTLYQQRSHIFIIMQALLFAGAVTAYKDASELRYLFIFAGLFVALCWLVVMQRQHSGTINAIKQVLRDYGKGQPRTTFFHIYYEIASARSRPLRPGLNTLIGYVIPWMFIFAWVAMLSISSYPTLKGLCHNFGAPPPW